ncbi:hypothetical protein [Pelodictyon luteolum]|uniref:hypothetical protein n=1 Tax=Pelodictyon luteolum TaxID=1100 RepID=UPI002690B733|nr:hypothetical protein [Pelodictyon luteolum]
MADKTILVVGASGYASVADAATAASTGNVLLIAAAAPISIATAGTISTKTLTVANSTLSEISDTAANISAANFSDAALSGFTTITNTSSNVTATLVASELGERAVTLSGDGLFQVTGTVAQLLALDSAVYSNTDKLILSDSASNISGLTTTQITTLVDRGLDQVLVSDGGAVTFTIAQTRAFGKTDAFTDTTTINTTDSGVELPVFTYVASADDDLLTGTASADTIDAGDSADVVNAGAGDDTITGGAGNDTLKAEAGDDRITGGSGNDAIDGGTGIDTAVYSGSYANYTITRAADNSSLIITDTVGTDGTDTVTNVEVLQFSNLSVRVVGAGGYADLATAVSAAGAGNVIFLPSIQAVTVADAALIASKSLSFNVTVNTLADTTSALSAATLNMAATGYTRYTTITATDSGAVSMGASELGNRALTLNGDFRVTGTIAQVQYLNTSTAASQVDILTVSDSSANLAALTVTSINSLRSTYGVDAFVGNGAISLTKAQIQAFSTSSTATLLTPGGDVTQIGTSSSETLTALGTSDIGYSLATLNTLSVNGIDIDGQIIDGQAGNDYITGSSLTDVLKGGTGSDYIIGGNGSDILQGGGDSDLYFVSSGDVVIENTNEGTDEVRTDQTSYTLTANVENLRYTGTANFTGTGNTLNNLIFGSSGNDTLKGGTGDDTLFGGAGADRLEGEGGNDTFIVGYDSRTSPYLSSYTTVSGSIADYASDTLIGGTGTDTLQFQGTADNQDLVVHVNTTGIERFVVLSQYGSSTSDALDMNLTSLLDDGEDHTLTVYANTEVSTKVSVGSITIDGAEIIGSTGANTLIGSGYSDVILGGSAEDGLYGGGGSDFIYGEEGNDQICGGDGNDIIVGGTGNDNVYGDAGNDLFVGGSGNDYFSGDAGADKALVATGSIISVSGDDRFLAVASATVTGTDGTDRYEGVEVINQGGSYTVANVSGSDPSQGFTITQTDGTNVDMSFAFRLFASDGVTLVGTYNSLAGALSAVTVTNGVTSQVITVADGATVDLTSSGSLVSGLTIIGSGTDSAARFSGTLNVNVTNFTLDGVRFEAVADSSTAVNITATGATIDHVTFIGDSSPSSAVGVTVASTGLGVTLTNNDFDSLTTGVVLPTDYAAQAVITGNTFADSTTGVFLDGMTGAADVSIDSNIFTGNSKGVVFDVGTYAADSELSIYANRFDVGTSASGVYAALVAFATGGTLESGLGATLPYNTFETVSTDNTSIAINATNTSGAVYPFAGVSYIVAGTTASDDTAVFDQPDNGLTLDLTNTAAVDFNNDGDTGDASEGTYVVGTLGESNVYLSTSGSVSTIENVTGTAQDDVITGDSQANTLRGLEGEDLLSGGAGDDILYGDAGDDEINGGAGNDTLYAGAGDDTLNGDAGNDQYVALEVSGTTNYFVGGDDTDTATFSRTISSYLINRADHLLTDLDGSLTASEGFTDDFFSESPDGVVYGTDFVAGEPIFQVDYIFTDGTRQTDYVQAENLQFSDVTLVWGTLAELETALSVSGLADAVDPSASFRTYDFVTSSNGTTPFTYNGGGLPEELTDPNYVLGSTGSDTVVGGDGADVILGRAGDDNITGGIGADYADGAEGADNYFITPQVYNDDGDTFVGDEFTTNEVIKDTGSSSTDLDEVHIIAGGTVHFDWGTLSGVEDVLYDSYKESGRYTEDTSASGNSVYATSGQFDGVNKFLAANGNSDYLEIEFTQNDTSLTQTTVDGVETVVLDTLTDGTGGENRLDAANITDDAIIYVRAGATSDSIRVDNLVADIRGYYGGTYDGYLDVNLKVDAGSVNIQTGSDGTTVTTRSGSSAIIDAYYLGGNLDLDGVGAVTVTNAGSITIDGSDDLSFDSDSSPLTGTLVVTTKYGANLQLLTGTNNTTLNSSGGRATVDAAVLNDDLLLTLTGSSDVTVSNLQGNVAASSSSGVLDITTATTVGDGEVTITTGTSNATITGTTDGHTVNVDADAMSTYDVLAVDGAADFVVTKVASGVTVDADGNSTGSALQGTLSVTTDAAATNVSVYTGVAATTINTLSTAGGSVSVQAAVLANDTTLDLNGASTIYVSGLTGDVDGSGMTSGSLVVGTADNTVDNDISVLAGNTDVYVNTAGSNDTVNVDAAALTASTTELYLGGSSSVVVTNLVRNLDANGFGVSTGYPYLTPLSGSLTVTTGELVNNGGISFVLGSGETVIAADEVNTGAGVAIDLTIDATLLTTNSLTLSGDAEVAVDYVSTDVNAGSLTGGLDIDAAVNGGTFTVTTGSGHTVVSGATGATITVEGDNLAQDSTISGALASAELVVDGSGTVTVNDLLADLNAAGFSGSLLTVNTQALTGDGTNPAIEIVTGTTNMTINGDDSNNTDKDVLDIRVDASALAGQSVSDVNQKLTLAGDAEYLIKNTSTGNTLYLDIYSIADDNTVALEGTGGFDLTGTSADVDASALSGAVTVHTKDTTTDNGDDIIVTAGTGVTTVDAVESVDKITLEAGLLLDDEADTYNVSSSDDSEVIIKGLGDVTVNALKADLDASTFSGTLTINRGQITGGAIDDVDIQVGVSGALINAGQAINLTYIDASAMGVDGTITLLGDGAPIVVDKVASGAAIDATGGTGGSALTGTLSITTASGATGVEVKTGSAATTVAADAGSLSVDATVLSAALTLSGSSAYTVTKLETNLVASATSGTITVSTDAITGSGTTPKLTITTGTGNMTVNGDDSVDGNTTDLDITINATSLSDTNSDTDLVLTGDAEYLITSTAGTGMVTIDASALEADGGLTLSGTGDFRLINTTRNVQAPNLSGRLLVETDQGAENDITVTAGTGSLGVKAVDSNDDIIVDALNLTDDESDNEMSLGLNSGTDDWELSAEGAGTVTVNNLDADLDASSLAGNLTANVTGGTDVDIKLNQTNALINTDSSSVTLDATAMGSGDTVTLKDGGTVNLFNAKNGITVDGSSSYTGALTVKTASLATGELVTVKTGSAATTLIGSGGTVSVDATVLADNTNLTVQGSSAVMVTSLQGDVVATDSTGTLEVTTVASANLNIGTGHGNATVTGTSGTVAVNANSMDAYKTLTVDGAASFTVSNVKSYVTVDADGDGTGSALSGALTVNTASAAVGVTVLTGTQATTVATGATAGGSLTVEADKLTNDYTLTLTGASTARVNDLIGDVNASALTGTLKVYAADNTTDNDITVTLGNANALVSGASSMTTLDTITVHAANMQADSNVLVLSGAAKIVVDGLVEDLDANGDTSYSVSALSGELLVTTGELTDNSRLQIDLGSASSTIVADEVNTGAGSNTEVVINAASMTSSGAVLTLSGDAEIEVDNAKKDINASALTGGLDVDTYSGYNLTVTTGSGHTVVSTAVSNTVTINADKLTVDSNSGAVTYELVVDGTSATGRADVINLAADLDANSLAGELDLVTAENASVNVKTGSNNSYIDANGTGSTVTVSVASMGSGVRLYAYGEGDFTVIDAGTGVVIDANGNTLESVNNSALSGTLDVTKKLNAIGTVVYTGTAATSITGTGGSSMVYAADLANDTLLTLSGSSTTTVTGLVGDIDAGGSTGTLSVTTANNGVDNDIAIETSAAATTIAANYSGDTVNVDAAVLADGTKLTITGASNFAVTALKGNLEADNGAGTLAVSLADATDVSVDTDRAATINAASLADDHTLQLTGSGTLTVNNLVGDIDANGVTGINSGAALTGALTINTAAVSGSAAASALTITTGSASTTVNGTDSVADDTETIDITVNALALSDSSDSTVLYLQGTAEYELQNSTYTAGKKVQVNLSGAADAGIVKLTGAGEYDLVETSTNINAGSATGPITVTTRVSSADTITVTAGTNDLTVDAANSGDLVTVNAASLVDDYNDAEISSGSVVGNDGTHDSYELMAEGVGQIVVKDLGADLDASTLSGSLAVTLKTNSMMGSVNDVDIKLNSSSASINTLASDATAVTLDAAAMGSGDTLSLAGVGAVEIFNADNGVTIDGKTGLTVNSSVVDFGGTLDIYTAALDASELVTVKTGSAKTTVSGAGSSSATVSIDAGKLSSSASSGDDDLVLKGTTAFVVAALGASVDAHLAEAVVDITTEASDSVADTLVVITGSANTMVTGTDASDKLQVNANAMATGDTLTIDGAADFEVTNISTGMTVDADGYSKGDSPLAGTLIATLEAGATGVTVLTGDEATTIHTSDSGSVTVNAAALDDNKLLTLDGAANATVIGLIGNVDAHTLTGTLGVQTANNANADTVSIITGHGTTSVDAYAGDTVTIGATLQEDNDVLTLTGNGTYVVNSMKGDIDAGSGTGTLTVDLVSPGDNTITVDSDRTTTIQAGLLSADNTLVLKGSGDISVVRTTGGMADGTTDVVTDGLYAHVIDASLSSGSIVVETAPIAGTTTVYSDGVYQSGAALTATTGSGDFTITADDSVDESAIASSTDKATAFAIMDVVVNSSAMASDDILTLKGDAEYYLTNVSAIVRASDDVDGTMGSTTDEYADDVMVSDPASVDRANFPNDLTAVAPEDSTTEVPYGGIDSNLSALASGNVSITGSAGDNIFTLGSGNDMIDGGAGSDYLRGGDGNDCIFGGTGSDYLFGGDGNDILFGGSGKDGSDFISGGDGIDTAVFVYTTIVEGEYVLQLGSSGNILTADQAKVSGAVSETYVYSFDRTTSAQGNQVEVEVTLTSGTTHYTDRVLADVEKYLFITPDDNPCTTTIEAKEIDDLVGSVINVNTGEKFATIQAAIDDSDTLDAHEILVMPNSYNENAIVSKDLTFFIQSGSTGVTLTLGNHYDAQTEHVLNLSVLSETDITINGNGGDNTITLLSKSDLVGWDDANAADVHNLDTNSALSLDGTTFNLMTGTSTLLGQIHLFDNTTYTVFGLEGDDNIVLDSSTTMKQNFFGGSGDDFLSSGQGLDWLDGGSGNDTIISVGGDDRILGGSGDDRIVLATQDDTTGGDGRVLILLGGGKDEVIIGALDNTDHLYTAGVQGIDIDAVIGDFARGDDRINIEGLLDSLGGTVDLSDLNNGSHLLTNGQISLAGFDALYIDDDGDKQILDAEGMLQLLGVNTARLSASDFIYGCDGTWRDEYESLLGLSEAGSSALAV